MRPGKYPPPPPPMYNYDFFTINSKGFRGNEFEEKKIDTNRIRIFAVGESSTMGLESSEFDTWPAKLQYYSDGRGKNYEVINAGFGSYSSLNYLNLIRHELIKYSPDIFIIYSGANDLNIYRNLTRKMVSDLISEIHKIFYYKSMLYTLVLEKVSVMISLNPVPFLFYDSTDMEEFEKNILEIVRISKERGIKLIFVRQMVYLPAELCLSEEPTMDEVKMAYKNNFQDKNGVGYMSYVLAFKHFKIMKRVKGIALKNNISFQDYREFFCQAEKDGLKVFYDYVHLRPEANDLLGRLISENISM